MDSLLIIDNASDCFCGHCKDYWDEFARALEKRLNENDNNPLPF
jgi:hypothetical protein